VYLVKVLQKISEGMDTTHASMRRGSACMAWPNSCSALSVTKELEGCASLAAAGGASRLEARLTRRAALPVRELRQGGAGSLVVGRWGPGCFFIAFSSICCALRCMPMPRRALALGAEMARESSERTLKGGLTLHMLLVASGWWGLIFRARLYLSIVSQFSIVTLCDGAHMSTLCAHCPISW
jgi:hypothetical protein